MISKTDQVRTHVSNGDYGKALSIAKTFRMLHPDDKVAIQKAHEANLRPDFYRQIKKDPDQLVRDGIAVLHRLYGK